MKDTTQEEETAGETKLVSPRFWITSSKGKRSASLTLAVIAFTITTIWLGLSIGGLAYMPFDSTAALAYLVPCLGLYFGRRHSESKEEK